MRMFSPLHGGLALALALAAPAAADKIHVPGDQPTVNAALAVANPGDTIQLAKGSHAGFTVSGKSDLRIRGAGKSVVDGSGDEAILVSGSQEIVIERLTIDNPGADGIVVSDSEDITIQKCRFEDVDGSGIRGLDAERVVVRKSTILARGNGIDLDRAGGTPSVDWLITRNRFEVNGNGVLLDGDGHVVEKNRFALQDGFAVDTLQGATSARVSKNRFDDPHNAIRLLGTGHLAEKNNVKRASFAGIRVGGSDCVVEENKIRNTVDHGIIIRGDDNQFLKNKISKTGGSGIVLDPESEDPPPLGGNTLEKNRIRKATLAGIYIDANVAGNTLTGNNAKGSGTFDLLSEVPEGDNTFDSNKFGTIEFD